MFCFSVANSEWLSHKSLICQLKMGYIYDSAINFFLMAFSLSRSLILILIAALLINTKENALLLVCIVV